MTELILMCKVCIKRFIIKINVFTDDVPYIWTSGRLCDFKGCESRKDLEPKNILGWFWSANREKISPTNQVSNERLVFNISRKK